VTATALIRNLENRIAVADHFDSSIDGFMLWLPYSGQHGPATIAQYAKAAQRLAAWARLAGRQDFAELTARDLRAFLASLTGRGGAPASKAWTAVTWSGVRSLFKYLEEEEEVADPTRRIVVPRPKAGRDRITHLDGWEVDKLLKACRNPAELAVISVCLDTGMRIAELASLRLSDVLDDDLRARRLVIRGKGSKTRAVVIGAKTTLALRKYLRQRAKTSYAGLDELWIGQRGPLTASGLDKMIRGVGANAALELYPHLLRHTWSHHYRLSGGSVDNMAVLAGWEGIQMALVYAKSAEAERAEAEARNLSLVDRRRGRTA